MSQKLYKINEFIGLNQYHDENELSAAYSPDCANMDTSGGKLSVAKGFTRFASVQIPGSEEFVALYMGPSLANMSTLAFTRRLVYKLSGAVAHWAVLHTFETPLTSGRIDFARAHIDDVDCLVIATGETQLMKYDGETISAFGSSELGSDAAVNYVTMYAGRLFAAGDALHPSRLYYSQLSGGGRSVEDWRESEVSPELSGGYVDVGGADHDAITCIASLKNQLLIFMESSIYRLIGDRPSNFIVERLCDAPESIRHTAFVNMGDGGYFMTQKGLYAYNGVAVYRTRNADFICRVLESARLTNCISAKTHFKLLFKLDLSHDRDCIVEYDLRTGGYMLRTGFTVDALWAFAGNVYMLNSNRYLYLLDSGTTYDGEPIAAHWRTPTTDLSNKGEIKALRALYARGEGAAQDAVRLETRVDSRAHGYDLSLMRGADEVAEVPLKDRGRTFSLKFANNEGHWFSLHAGVELLLACERRVE
ncbi:MAG: hypothetical protein Q4B99_02200 [Clostridia bacterium]|nr:hypothetical protein [Clostridia bacterium]